MAKKISELTVEEKEKICQFNKLPNGKCPHSCPLNQHILFGDSRCIKPYSDPNCYINKEVSINEK